MWHGAYVRQRCGGGCGGGGSGTADWLNIPGFLGHEEETVVWCLNPVGPSLVEHGLDVAWGAAAAPPVVLGGGMGGGEGDRC